MTQMAQMFFETPDKRCVVHWGRVRSDVSSLEELFSAVARELKFPSYFGGNLDALYDCLCDLTWFSPGLVVLEHEPALKASKSPAFNEYVKVLRDSLLSHEKHPGPQLLHIIFSESERELVTRSLDPSYE